MTCPSSQRSSACMSHGWRWPAHWEMGEKTCRAVVALLTCGSRSMRAREAVSVRGGRAAAVLRGSAPHERTRRFYVNTTYDCPLPATTLLQAGPCLDTPSCCSKACAASWARLGAQQPLQACSRPPPRLQAQADMQAEHLVAAAPCWSLASSLLAAARRSVHLAPP